MKLARDDPIDFQQPRFVAFHGTPKENLLPIAEDGLKYVDIPKEHARNYGKFHFTKCLQICKNKIYFLGDGIYVTSCFGHSTRFARALDTGRGCSFIVMIPEINDGDLKFIPGREQFRRQDIDISENVWHPTQPTIENPFVDLPIMEQYLTRNSANVPIYGVIAFEK